MTDVKASTVARRLRWFFVLGSALGAACSGGGGDDAPSPPSSFTVGGTVTGLAGTGLVLQNNGGNNLTVNANGAFTFTATVANGNGYNVTVATQPTATPAQICTVTNGMGTIAGAAVTNVVVECRARQAKLAYVPNITNSVAGFSLAAGTGALTPIAGSPFAVSGSPPLGSTVHPLEKFLYVTGGTFSSQANPATLEGFVIDSTSGALTPIPGLPITFTGANLFAFSPAIHPNGSFMYVVVGAGGSNFAGANLYSFSIDGTTGALTPLPDSPRGIPNGDGPREPVMSADGNFLYMPHGRTSPAVGGSVTVFAVNGTTGALTLIETESLLGRYPNGIARHPSGKWLYTRNSDGSVAVIPVDATSGVLSTPTFVTPLPTGPGGGVLFADGGRYVYFPLQGDLPPTTVGGAPVPGPGSIAGYAVDQTTGALTPLPGSPYPANGNTTGAASVDPTGRFLVATNFNTASVAVFEIGGDGTLAHVPGSPFAPAVGTQPGAVVFDPSAELAYLTDLTANAGSLSVYSIANGVITFVGSSATGGTATATVELVGTH